MVLVNIYSQAIYEDMVSYKLMDSQDTLIINRHVGEFWFGFRGGISTNKFFGNFKAHTLEIGNPSDRLFNYDNGSGNGYFFGLLGEWLPIESSWGIALNINFWDKINSVSTSVLLVDSLNPYYELTGEFRYIAITANARYDIWKEGLYFTGGFDVNIPVAFKVYQDYKYQNSEQILYRKSINLNEVNIITGLNLGLGYDFFSADMYDKARALFTPFASIHLGSSMISDEGSSWNNLQFKFGFAIKIGLDKIKLDTLFLDPNYKTQPEYLATSSNSSGVTFSGFRHNLTFETATLKAVPVPKVQIEVPVKEKPLVASAEVSIPPKRENQINKILNNPKDTLRMGYNRSDAVDLSAVDKKELDLVINYLKKNPDFELRIVGFSDDAGTFKENTERSKLRAEGVKQYFIDSGLPKESILATWSGSFGARAPNNTEAGRKLNRRVDLLIVRKK
jgi:outer membrane protein OmpA-like peptidoglycan-associated protein